MAKVKERWDSNEWYDNERVEQAVRISQIAIRESKMRDTMYKQFFPSKKSESQSAKGR